VIYLTHCSTVYTEAITLIDDIPYPQHAHILPGTFKHAKKGVVYPPHKVLERALEPEIVSYVRDIPVAGKTAFLFAAGNQGWMGTNGRYDQNPDAELHYKVKLPFIVLTNIYAGRIAAIFGVIDHIATDASACASSLKVLMDVQNLINNFGFDRVVILSGEDSVNNLTLEFFGEAGASLQHKDEAAVRPSAFDPVNRGFFLGQGATLAVFEKEHPKMSEPLARFLGAYTASEDNNNPLSQREDGEGYAKAIEGTLLVAKTPKSVVNLVKTHGTGTPVNNAAEKSALQRTLGEFIATSYKQRIGHTMGASGLLETGILLKDIAAGSIPAIPNRTEEDSVFLSSPATPPKGPFISLAAGMGNVYSAALFECVL
jgi:3-oxoacyl-(acyl-carrier-protein) synthase